MKFCKKPLCVLEVGEGGYIVYSKKCYSFHKLSEKVSCNTTTPFSLERGGGRLMVLGMRPLGGMLYLRLKNNF